MPPSLRAILLAWVASWPNRDWFAQLVSKQTG
jgi:hypothetical protein